MKRINRKELEGFDGQEGRPAYVVVEGKVYDVSASKRWPRGRHMNSHVAGGDLTQMLASAPHGPEVLERVLMVGELEEAQAAAGPQPPTGLLGFVLAQHPHPVSVHFPIALLVTAAAFTAIGLVTGQAGWHHAAFLNLCFGTLGIPPAIAAGLLSQRFNYAGTWTPLFRAKLAVSLVLLLIAVCTVYLRICVLGFDDPGASGGAVYWIYTGLVLIMAPIVISLGYLGGRITFPR